MYGLEDKVEHEPTVEKMDEFFDARIAIYDRHMLEDLKLDGFYRAIVELIAPKTKDFRLLDLGCGTGIELAYLYERYPDMRVTGIDLSPKMLERLREKFPDRKIALIQGSYFDIDFDGPYDVVLSTYSFHHFDREQKLKLYTKIREALAKDGVFVFGDYTSWSTDEEVASLARFTQVSETTSGASERASEALYHIDTPLTVETEVALLRQAGFESVEVVYHCVSVSIIVAHT